MLCRAVPAMCGISPGFRGFSDPLSSWRRQTAVGGDGIDAPVSVCCGCGSVWSRAAIRAGNDIVFDWEDGSDVLDFSAHSAVGGIDDLIIAQSGIDTRISFGGDSVLLTNVTATDIDASHLIF